MALTAAEMVDKIDDCIQTLVEGTASTRQIGNRTYTALDLDKLRQLRQVYVNQANASTVNDGTSRPIKFFGLRMREAGSGE